MRWGAAIGLIVLLSGAGARHEFFVSITEVHQKQDTLQVAMKLFTDDLERAINEQRPNKIFLEPQTDMNLARRAVSGYLSGHFAISVAAKELREEWLGHEYIEDVTWVYAQVALPEGTRIAFIRNTVLTDVLPDQQNIIHFQSGENMEKLLTNRSKPEVQVLIE